MEEWAPIEIDDALELLTKKFTNPQVRSYAVGRLNDVVCSKNSIENIFF